MAQVTCYTENLDTTHVDIDLFESLTDMVESTVAVSGGRKNIDKWIIANTSDPLSAAKPWSFKNHEYQIGIVTSQAPRNYIMKVSQIGVSEAIVRLTLALLAKMPGRHAIYTLPDAAFAKAFAPSRFDPVVEASKRLKSLVSSELNNTRIKQIGSSYLHITGTQKESQSISVPASILIHDEWAYSQPEVLGTFNSRLGHLQEGEEIVYAFSTCLFPNSDIHAAFLEGTCDTYMVYHRGCNHWVPIDPLLSLRLPGFKGQVELLEKQDLSTFDPDQAYIECPHCKRAIAMENLADPECRAWVPEFPGRPYRSFDANYLVAPHIRPPSKVLRGRANYRSTAKWLNFDVGRPADSSDSRITDAALSGAFCLPQEDNVLSYSVTVGMDVGKVGHRVVMRRVNEEFHIIDTHKPIQTADNYLATAFFEAYTAFKARQGVIDAGPEFTVVTKAQAMLPYGQVHGCYFVTTSQATLGFFSLNEEEGLVKAQRTKAISEFVDDFNKGKILFRRGNPDETLIKKHLKNMARISDYDALGVEKVVWKSLGEDHYFFAVFYAWLAQMIIGEVERSIVLPSTELVTKTRMKRA